LGSIDLNQIGKPYITKDLLFQEVSDENIFRYYIKDLQIGKIMHSPLREDKNPSFGVYVAKPQNELFYKDFALGAGDCIKFVSELLHLSYYEALSQIALDFGLENKYTLSKGLNKSPVKGVYNKSISKDYSLKSKVINVTAREWKQRDINFWKQFGISLKILEAYNVFPIKWLFINDEVYNVDRLAYAFMENKDDIITYKIYQPYSKYKWISNQDKSIHQGYKQLPDSGEMLIITKSRKDVMSLCAVMEIPAIGIQSESIIIKESVLQEYKDRFKKIYVLFDNDSAGITLAFRYKSLFNIPILVIPSKYGCKDFSDLVKKYGVEESKEIFKELIKYDKSNI